MRLLTALLLGLAVPATATAQTIDVKSVILKLIAHVDVPAKEAGVLESIAVKEGQAVEEGTLLAQIEDNTVRLQRQQVELELKVAAIEAENEAEIAAAEQELKVAEQDLQRAKLSKEKVPSSVSASEFDHLRLNVVLSDTKLQRAKKILDVARAKKQLREKIVEQADDALQRRKIASPLHGVVVEVYRQRGEWVEPGEKVLRIVRIDRLRAEGFIDAQYVRANLAGSAVTLKVESPGEADTRFPGKVVFVSPEVDPVNRQTRIWAEIENRGLRLYPGLRAQMTIVPGREP